MGKGERKCLFFNSELRARENNAHTDKTFDSENTMFFPNFKMIKSF